MAILQTFYNPTSPPFFGPYTLSTPVNAGDSVIVDQVENKHRAVKWMVAVTTDTATRMVEINAVTTPLGSGYHSLFSDLGDKIDVVFDVVFDTSVFTLQITNNTTAGAVVNFVRIQVV